jgi:hypothetical protein
MSVYRCNTTKEFSIAFYVKYKKIELSHRIHLKLNLSDTHISWKGYLIGSLTPKINIHLMAYKKKQTVWRCLRQKSYFHFRFNTNSGGFFPMQSFFYFKPQGYQIWTYNYPKIYRFLLTFSILQYLIGFIFYPTM